ncbi:hypothetical protein CBG18_05150, partial [Limosilactobacillus reuteri]
MESTQTEATQAYVKHKKGIWISTGIFAFIGLAGGILGAILFALFGFFISFLFALIAFKIKETPEEKAYFREQRKKLNAQLEKESQERKETRVQRKLAKKRKREEEQHKREEAEREREELYKKQVEWWLTEDLSIHAKKIDGLKLSKNEYCYYKSSEPINWKEDRVSTRRINYGGLTATIHIAKGLNYRLGSINTAINKSAHIVTVLTGTLFLTNKRIIVASDNQIKAYTFKRLLKMEPYSDGVALYSSAGKRVILDGFTDATHFNIYLD